MSFTEAKRLLSGKESASFAGFREKNSEEDSLQVVFFTALIIIMMKTGFTRFRSMVVSSKFAPLWLRRWMCQLLLRDMLGTTGEFVGDLREFRSGLPVRYGWVGGVIEEIAISSSEPEVEDRNAMLDRVFLTSLIHCRHSIKEFFGSLKIPLTSIFALCIILPIIIASMLPLIDLNAGSELGSNLEPQPPETILTVSWLKPSVLLSMITLAFPIICAFATASLLKRARNILHHLENKIIDARTLACLILLLAFLIITGMSLDVNVSIIVILCSGLVFGLIFDKFDLCGPRGRYLSNRFQSPTFLNEASSRIRKGEHPVRALSLSADRNPEKGAIFWSYIAQSAQGKNDGAIADFLLESSSKNPLIASDIMRSMASHFTEIEMVRNDSRIELKSIGQSITVASILLCPFVLGLIAGMSDLAVIRGSFESSPIALQEVFAVLVVEMAFVGGLVNITFFLDSYKQKKSRWMLLSTMCISVVIFLVSREISAFIFF